MSKKDVLGTLSPAYGLMSGQGVFGKLADAGMGGIIPSMLADRRKDKKEDAEEAARIASKNPMTPIPAPAMKKGGSIKSSASKRADGIAIRGKTKGRMV